MLVCPRAAGLDVHKTRITAALRVCEAGGGPARVMTREFSALPDGLQTMTDWLLGHGVTAAALENTGVYWKAAFEALEDAGFRADLYHAEHVRQIRGSERRTAATASGSPACAGSVSPRRASSRRVASPDALGEEGSPIDVSRARTDGYASDRKILMLSTPTTDAAPVSVWHDDGDRRRWFVPCPECHHHQPLDWPALDFDDDGKSGPVIRCVECEHGITESERRKILELGEWRATAEPADPTIASFHLSRLDSPFSSLADIVRAFRLARRKQKRGDPHAMNTATTSRSRSSWRG